MKIKGINVKKGQFNGRDYHNFEFFGYDEVSKKWEIEKCKADIVVRDLKIDVDDVEQLIDSVIEFYYDKFGKVQRIQLI